MRRRIPTGSRESRAGRGPRRARRARRSALRGRRRRTRGTDAAGAARSQLRRFRQASVVAVAMTGLLLLFVAPGEAGEGQEPGSGAEGATVIEEVPDTVAVIERIPTEELVSRAAREGESAATDAEASAEEATWTLRSLWQGFVGNLPKYGIVLAILGVAWLLSRLARLVLERVLGRWQRSSAIIAITGIVIWLLALGIAASVLVGDIRALVGSLGLIGLALSWALQTPIESFTGWLLNSFHGYYRVGDRIAVGEIFGDVYRIDFLTTTLWEYGGEDRPPGSVRAEQPTGRLITFPNNEVLAGSIVNYTRDFPYVWDEAAFAVANESDLRYAMRVIGGVAERVMGERMAGPAEEYEAILRREGLATSVATAPQLFVSLQESWTDVVVRYLVAAREKRVRKSELVLSVVEELNRPEHAARVLAAYPRRQVQLLDPEGRPSPAP